MASRLQAILGHLTGLTATATAAAAIQSIIMSASVEKPGRTDSDLLDDPATAKSEQTFVTTLLQRLYNVIKASQDVLDPALRKVYRRALEGAHAIEGFAKDNPVFCHVVALGVLYIMAPMVIHLLGFTAKGPAFGKILPNWLSKARADRDTKGSWAAAWQSTYGGIVPAKSLFAYLQHLSMAAVV